MKEQVTLENNYADIILLSFTGDNSSACKKIRKYQKNLESVETTNDDELLATKQMLAESIVVAGKVKSVVGLSNKKKQTLRQKANPTVEEKEMISILDNSNKVCQVVSLIELMELAIKHNDHDMLRYGKERANSLIDKLYGYQSESLRQYLKEELESLKILA